MPGAGKVLVMQRQLQRKKNLKRVWARRRAQAEECLLDLSPAEVKDWLASVGFLAVGEAAEQEGVSGLALPHLGHDGWFQLGVDNAVARAKIMGELDRLGKPQEANEELKEPEDVEGTEGAMVPMKSSWRRLKRLVLLKDAIPCDHKRVWFDEMARSGKPPEEIKDSLSAQMDSYNLLTLLLLATILPTATGICDKMEFDSQGWPENQIQFVYLVFSATFSFLLYLHFGFSHATSVMFADVSNVNLRLFMEAIGIPLLAELGMLFAANFFGFLCWVIFSVVALISSDAHWAIWLIVILGIPCASFLMMAFSAKVLARSSFETNFTSIAWLTRLQLHSGLFCNDVIPIDPTLPRQEILERLAERALQQLDRPPAAPVVAPPPAHHEEEDTEEAKTEETKAEMLYKGVVTVQ